ncbi:MAG TPA: serine/threonine-protein kinase [Opitutales bacterium]|nr:serine/threonine-protein kinase [Opitutales bacterium]
MSEQEKCSRCGTSLTKEVPGGLCGRCVVEMNLSPETMDTRFEGAKTAVPPLPPEKLADKFPQFEILECLGRGGMGVVYKARQKALDRLVAIKILAGEWQGEAGFKARFETEAKLLAQLSHSNIVTVHDFGNTEDLFYIVMEFIDGVNLRDLLREGKMEPEQALAVVPTICEALEYAHEKGVVHRDIKPENILLDRDGRVKIADFGIASLVGAEGERSGTPPYMAPEQAGGVVDRRADIYALGAVLYEMLTGERPGEDLVAPSKRVEVDVKIDEMVLRALEKEPERRYQSAVEFRTAVQTMPARKDGKAGAETSSAVGPGAPKSGQVKADAEKEKVKPKLSAMAVAAAILVTVGPVIAGGSVLLRVILH